MTLTTPPLTTRPLVTRPRGWQAAAGLTALAAGAVIVTGAFLPWVEAFAGLMQVSGTRGSNGWILAAAGALIAGAGLVQLARRGDGARWAAGLAGFAAAGFSGYLLVQLAKSMRVLGGDSMVIARPSPGLWVALTGALAAFVTLFFPPSTQDTLRRDGGRPALAWMADREAAGLRRGLQIALGLVWVLDAALQYQPVMFTRSFPSMMLMPSAMGEPAFVSGPVLTASRLIAGHVVPWNAMFATVQLVLGLGLLARATTRAALAGTIAWGLGVWWLGEGLGGIFGGMADPLTGAPGAALLYAFLAVLLWPRPRPASSWGTRVAWAALWGTMAVLMLTAPAASASLTASGGTRAAVVTAVFTAAFALAAVGVLVPATTRPALVLAMAAALAAWGLGQDFGALFSGTATDLNTGPLLVLVALAYWPGAAGSDRSTTALIRSSVVRMPSRLVRSRPDPARVQ